MLCLQSLALFLSSVVVCTKHARACYCHNNCRNMQIMAGVPFRSSIILLYNIHGTLSFDEFQGVAMTIKEPVTEIQEGLTG